MTVRGNRTKCLVGLAAALAAAAGLFFALQPRPEPDVPPAARCHAKYEARFPPASLGLGAPRDPYDPDAIAVDARVTTPSGKRLAVPCFWLVPQERYFETHLSEDRSRTAEWERFRPSARGVWCLRFNPREPGVHPFEILVKRKGRERVAWTGAFTASPAREGPHGPLRVAPGGRYFEYATGGFFLPVGENLGWPEEAGSRIYAEWLRRLGEAGGNCGRLWLTHYMAGTTLEWTKKFENPSYAGAGRYNQAAGARVDRILDAAEASGVHLMLCFLSFGDTNWDWKNHPYNKENGGWLEDPEEIFTDARARRAVRNRLRYTVARYGWSDHIWAWELWNEVETSYGYEEKAATEWHREMAAHLKRLDAHGHMISTSYRWTPPWPPNAAYSLPDFAFAQAHSYRWDVLAALPARIGELAEFGKPRLVSEFSIGTSPAQDYARADPAGLHVHDGLWVAPFAGAAGVGMTWWWERYIHPRDLYFHFTGVSRFFKGEDLRAYRPAECAFEVWTEPAPAGAWALASERRVLLWVAAAREIESGFDEGFRYVVTRYARPAEPTEAVVRVEGLPPRPRGTKARAVLWDTVESVPIGEAKTRLDPDGTVRVWIPSFRESVAVKIDFLPRGAAPAPVTPPATMPLRDRFEKRVYSEPGAAP